LKLFLEFLKQLVLEVELALEVSDLL